MSDMNQTAPRKRFFTGRRIAIAGVAALGIAALGATAVYSQSHGGWGHGYGYGHQGHGRGWQGQSPQGNGMGPMGPDGQQGRQGMMGQGMMGRGMFGFGPMGRLDDALSSVGASAEQKEKVFAIARQAMTELMPLRDRRFVARTRLQELMKAPTLDRTAIEKLRAEEFAAYDAGSKRAAQALADAAEVLRPEQRQQLVERLESRRRWWRG